MGSFDMRDHNDLCVGIDLGTTNSVLATINEKQNGDIVSKVVEISRGVDMYNAVSGEAKLTTMKKPTLPSCIYYRQEKKYEPLVGDFAKMQYPLRPHLVAKSIKSQMGKPLAEGLSSDIPDKTPAQISSRILKHMLKEASKICRCDITDAVITVPANFDSAMCKATRDAAELAGIKIKNADGTERPVLLSEPNAVIYDLINQIHNGEISHHILDLSKKKTVLVFDLGGGTLDITMHEIKKREDNDNVLKVDEIATNRYTRLGGDDFDEEIAKAMYERYINQFASHPDVVSKLKKEENVIMPQLRVYAEHLKLELNERCGDDYDSGWDDPDDEIEIPTGGNMGGIGYSYDDTFSKEEVEKILSVFMADELSYDDYKHIDRIRNTRNIIFPILDVLKKAADKMGTDNVVVDEVIVNGGMSKFYMITDRLKKFFGFDPIVALDPDQAVARGAAVYHYYLHKYEEMQDDMKMLGNTDSVVEQGDFNNSDVQHRKRIQPPVQWGNNILNDCLYLGVKNGGVSEIIPTGAELPYTSDIKTGFGLEPGQNMIAIPIKSRNLDGSYRTIANGNIIFNRSYHNGAYVAFQVYMGSNKVINMKAWTSNDPDGINRIEEKYAEISIDNSEKSKIKSKFLPPSGSNLLPKSEIENMLRLCRNYESSRLRQEKTNISKRISSCVSSICSAGNKSEFANVVLSSLSSVSSNEAKMRLFIIARKIGTEWSETDKKRLASECINQLNAEINGFSIGGPKVSANIQAIYTLSICGNMQQLSKLAALHNLPKYLQACLYTHSRTKSELEWLQSEFESDVKKSKKHIGNNIQFSSNAIGVAFKEDGTLKINGLLKNKIKIVKILCEVIQAANLSDEELNCCIIALGNICDQRVYNSEFPDELIQSVLDTIQSIDCYYSEAITIKQDKAQKIAIKMINGELLDMDEEQFLLTKLEL